MPTVSDFVFAGAVAVFLNFTLGSLVPDYYGFFKQLTQTVIAIACTWWFSVPRPAKQIPSKAPQPQEGHTPVYTKGEQTWTTDSTKDVKLRFAPNPDSVASKEKVPVKCMHDYFKESVERLPDAIALAVERPCPEKVGPKLAPALPWDQWTKWTVKEWYEEVCAASKAIMADYDFPQFGAVGIYGFNAPEWHMGALCGVMAGGKGCGIYPTDTAEHVVYKLKLASTSVAFVEGEKHVKLLLDHAAELPDLKAIVFWDMEQASKISIGKSGNVEVISWPKLIESGRKRPQSLLEERWALIKPGHCAMLAFTSGTTGMPKACMLSHDNASASAMSLLFHNEGVIKGPQRILSYLPLSHVAGFAIDVVVSVGYPGVMGEPATIYFARKYDMTDATLPQRMEFVKPTVFLGVPRVWEKIAEGMKAIGAKIKFPMSKVRAFVKEKMLEHGLNCQMGGSGEYPTKYAFANFITGQVRKRLGLHELQMAVTGAAPIQRETLEYWASLGINIIEIFGMSESSALVTVNSTKYGSCWGTIGYALPGVDVAVFNTETPGVNKPVPIAQDVHAPTEAECGELCFRGRQVMMGYMANPKFGSAHVSELEKKNAELIDDEGWVHSGDKACKGPNGMFRITGRYKELIITAGGENIAPVPIEDWVKSNYGCISNFTMIGDERKYNTCLITLKLEGATGQEPGTNVLLPVVKDMCDSETIEEAMKDPKVLKYCEDAIKAVNANQKVVPSNACKIQKFKILPLDFSVSGEEYTPTLKLKRSYVAEKFKKYIDEMY